MAFPEKLFSLQPSTFPITSWTNKEEHAEKTEFAPQNASSFYSFLKIRPKKHVFERAYSQIKEYLCTDSQPTQAAVAQLVEHGLPKPRVAGSSPVCRSI